MQPSLKQITGFVLIPDILIGSEKPNMVYLTNTPCSSSQAFQTGAVALFKPRAGGGFSLCMSTDGGTNWRNITAPSNLALSMGGGSVDPQGGFYDIATTTPNSAPEIWRYDPTTNAWSKIAALPAGGSLQAVTTIGTNGNIAMWYLATAQGKYVLYRYEA